jgi:Zn-finger nucleic acid-binding protein
MVPPRDKTGPVNCPNDGETLLMTERRGVEIDYCPSCRGVWLDRGELDKLMQVADRDDDDDDDDRRRADRGDRDEPYRGEPYRGEPYRDEPYRERPYDRPSGHRPRKKRSFLSEMFEFGD